MAATTAPRSLLVTGATGKQGGALISALLAKSTHQQPFEIHALTRNKTSAAARSLARKGVRLIEGNSSNFEAVFKQIEKPWGAFLVTTFDKGVQVEEQQGKEFASAAINAGVNHIVFSATDRGVHSDQDATPIAHCRSKFNIERDIAAKAQRSQHGTTWTFLRPVAFMENMAPNFFGRAFVAMWRLNGEDRRLQLVSTVDVGRVAAEAFLHADEDGFRNEAISLAGDSITPAEAGEQFKRVTGQEIPATYPWLGWALRKGLREQLGTMFDWFRNVGFGADARATRARFPFMLDFATWVEKESAWRKK